MRPERKDISKMRKFDNLEGRQFGEITLLYPIETPEYVGESNKSQFYWAQCSCGKEWAINRRTILRNTGGRTGARACAECTHKIGAEKRVLHGLSYDRTYRIWISMKGRCSEKWATNSHGARGIEVCEEWNKEGKEGFLKFHEWSMANGYAEGLTLERLDVNGPYSPENCAWVGAKDQNYNKRNSLKIEVNEEMVSLSQYYYSEPNRIVPYSVIANRHRAGWTLEEMFSIPYGGKRGGGSILRAKKEIPPSKRPPKAAIASGRWDWSGANLGNLTILFPIKTPAHISPNNKNQFFWARCSCGKEYHISDHTIRKDVTACKNCTMKEVGMQWYAPDRKRNKRLRRIWLGMKKRCRDKGVLDYKERGIRVCPVWYKDFYEFYEWAINNGYDHHLTLDRIDNDGPYSPENCQWITKREQNYNKRNTLYVEYQGEKWSLARLYHHLKSELPYDTVYSRHNRGWSAERIFFTPYKGKKKE